jgi:glycosyltransferase involved in cell wall biosynthesis
MQPLVSVIIPVYERLTYLNAAIESVLAQTYRPYEIIVVDDGSTVDVRKHLEPYSDIITCLRKTNEGMASARNFGTRWAKGEFVAFLDDDDIFLPEKLVSQVDILRDKPEVALVYSDEYLLDEAGRMEQVAVRADRNPPLPSGYIARDFFMDSFIGVMTVLIRRTVFEEVGGFDEYMLFNEDDDLWFRIMLQFPVICSEYVSGARRVHGTNMSRDRAKMTLYQLRCIDKYIDSFPDFIRDNCGDVRQRVGSLMSEYLRWCVNGCKLPSLQVMKVHSRIKNRLNRLLADSRLNNPRSAMGKRTK